MSKVKVTVEISVSTDDWFDYDKDGKLTKKERLTEIKSRMEDLEILVNQLQESRYEVIKVQEVKLLSEY